MEIYCVKCKEKTTAKSPKKVTMKNGMNSLQGTCSDCGTRVSVITGKSDKSVTRNASEKPAKPAKAAGSKKKEVYDPFKDPLSPFSYGKKTEKKEVKRNSSKEIHRNQMQAAKSLLGLRQYGFGASKDWLEGYIFAQASAYESPELCLDAKDIIEAVDHYAEKGKKR